MKNQQQQNEKPKFKIKIAHKGWWITALVVAVLAYLAFKGANLYLNYINI